MRSATTRALLKCPTRERSERKALHPLRSLPSPADSNTHSASDFFSGIDYVVLILLSRTGGLTGSLRSEDRHAACLSSDQKAGSPPLRRVPVQAPVRAAAARRERCFVARVFPSPKNVGSSCPRVGELCVISDRR
jgi:hypothetical protein